MSNKIEDFDELMNNDIETPIAQEPVFANTKKPPVKNEDMSDTIFEKPESLKKIPDNPVKLKNPRDTHISSNPLSKYFRRPGIHIKIPSNGNFNDPNDIDFTVNEELPIYPMTASDEMILKNPDALLNGYALEQLISSCVPGIKNIREIPSPDVDVILLAIRGCSQGDSINMSTECPKCSTTNEVKISTRNLLSNITFLPEECPIRIDDEMVVYVKPYTFESNTRASLLAFEEAKKFQVLEEQDIDERSKMDILNESFNRVSQLELTLNTESIEKIVIPGESVTNKEFIYEFLKNTDKNTYKKIAEKIKSLNEFGIQKEKELTCKNCNHEWKTNITFDPSRFFE